MLGFALRGQIAEILQEYVFEMLIAVYRARDRHLETRPELVQPLKTKWDVLHQKVTSKGPLIFKNGNILLKYEFATF